MKREISAENTPILGQKVQNQSVLRSRNYLFRLQLRLRLKYNILLQFDQEPEPGAGVETSNTGSSQKYWHLAAPAPQHWNQLPGRGKVSANRVDFLIASEAMVFKLLQQAGRSGVLSAVDQHPALRAAVRRVGGTYKYYF